jgi:pimeloyl-ACP methyl ester carboxylesterase
LYLRASSTASSLEQRPLYENVHSQVNSRFKAIKDSLQDSSSRLLSMPSLHRQDIRYDWGSRPSFFNENGMEPTTADRGINNGPSVHTAPPPPPPKNNPQSTHPILEEAMSELTGDVVILGGYRGSILRSAKPPHRQLWVPMKVGLNLRKVDLEVGLTREDEERMEESIIPSGVLSHVGPVDVCRRLMKRLRKCDNCVRGDLRVWDYGYDWRLSPELLSARLIAFLERLPCNRPSLDGALKTKRGATVIAHSLGGLITRHAVNQRPDLFAGVVYAGVPQHCVNILGPLRNGDDVLLSSRVLTAQVNFTFRTSFALLPEDGHCFIDKQSKEEFRVDFFDAKNWEEYRLSPCMGPALQPPTGGSVFKDFATISKRFSLGPRDSLPDLQDINDPNNNTTSTEEDRDPHTFNPGHTRPHSIPNITDTAQDKASDALLQPPLEGIVGPAAPRSSTSTNKISTTVTIPHATAEEYLQRTLREVKRFKSELEFRPAHQADNKYPPAAVIYGKSVPTVYGARVTSREAIKQQDCYDDLAFAAGDGVCLASAAMLPPGYRIIKNGLVKSDRGHVGLLGDLEGVGECLRAIIRGRREGVGMGSATASTVAV